MSNARKAKGRSAWWVVHHWAGLKLGVLITFVLMTGTVATVSNEIDWLATPSMRVMPRPGPMANWGDWYRAASRDGATVEQVHAPLHPGFAVRAKISDRDGHARFVQIDPWTAKVRGVGSIATVQDVVRDLHRSLMLPTAIGIPLVSFLSIPLLLTLATAFKVYKKWWRGFARWPRPMRYPVREKRRYVGDLHRLAGVWSLWFLAVIGSTGLWYFAERLGAEASELPDPQISQPSKPTPDLIDAIVAKTRETWPGLAVRSLTVEDGLLTLEGDADALLARERAKRAWYAATDGHALATSKGIELSIHHRVSEAADPLHFGTWGGLASKLVWFAFGCILSFLAATGTLTDAFRIGADTPLSVMVMTAMSLMLIGFSVARAIG